MWAGILLEIQCCREVIATEQCCKDLAGHLEHSFLAVSI